MNEKIIIENRSRHGMETALIYVKHVINGGRISDGGYCYVTTWADGTVVLAKKNKSSDRFVIMNKE